MKHRDHRTTRGTTARAYSRYGRIYDLIFDHLLAPGRRAAVEALAPRAGDRVLEIGIGTGLSIPYYPPGCSITGIDLSDAMLENASRKLETDPSQRDIRLLRMDASRLAFQERSFDRVLASYVLSTVPDPSRVLREILRVSRPGARLVIVNRFQSGFLPAAWLSRWLTPLTWRLGFRMDLPLSTVLRRADLDVVARRRVNLLGLWTLVVAEVRAPQVATVLPPAGLAAAAAERGAGSSAKGRG